MVIPRCDAFSAVMIIASSRYGPFGGDVARRAVRSSC